MMKNSGASIEDKGRELKVVENMDVDNLLEKFFETSDVRVNSIRFSVLPKEKDITRQIHENLESQGIFLNLEAKQAKFDKIQIQNGIRKPSKSAPKEKIDKKVESIRNKREMSKNVQIKNNRLRDE